MKQTILTTNQNNLLESLLAKHGHIVTTEHIYAESQSSADQRQVKKVIAQLVKNGWLVRMKRGLYAISNFSNRGFLSLSPYLVANLLVQESYVSFESALAHHGMFDQLTSTIISIAATQYKTVQLQGTVYSYVRANRNYFFGWQEVSLDGRLVRIATAEKALVDIIHFHKSKYSVDVVIEKLLEHRDSVDMETLIAYVGKMSITTIKIFGFILDLLQIDSHDLHTLVKIKQGTHWMLAGDAKFNAKWRLYYDAFFDKYQPANARL
jgi:predicted transcriptional regulator of viral defense system